MAQDTLGMPVKPVPVTIPEGSLSKAKLTSRKWMAGSVTAIAYGGSFIALNIAWYKGYPRSRFHTFNDAGEWLQVDKVGHGWSAYTTSRLTSEMWEWAGLKKDKAVLLGTGISLAYMLSIEYLDGRSAEWGWSWPDAAADMSGALLFAMQEWGWKEQRIQYKFSSFYHKYGDPSLQQRADELFGSSFPERLLKDYNRQSYWLSFNMKSFLPGSNFPGWLNLSVGYGAGGMFGGYVNIAEDKDGNLSFDRRDIRRYRQWYLAPDIDFTKIHTHSHFMRGLLSVANILKFPSPALEFSSGGVKVKGFVF
jgi:uncharacterized protein YfiM (DUF2279 family)